MGRDSPKLDWQHRLSTFEQRLPLIQPGRLFDPALQQSGIQWDAITDLAQKRDLAL